ncbi:MAG: nitrous oxide-stimulated promoter family protein [Verrucomicrobia bacterium]|nr:nitrous oxide-stimulated promoter family protein [Verrucomicrobiota bacterium]
MDRRLERERRTIEAMIVCFCRGVHGSRDELCADCEGLLDYATLRLQRCPFGENKPTCAKCPIHCYQPQLREKVKAVMRYAGPRVFWRHPILSVKHFLDAYRQTPPVPGTAASERRSK